MITIVSVIALIVWLAYGSGRQQKLVDLVRNHRGAVFTGAVGLLIFEVLVQVSSINANAVGAWLISVAPVISLGLLLALTPLVFFVVSRSCKGVLAGTRKSFGVFCQHIIVMVLFAWWALTTASLTYNIFVHGLTKFESSSWLNGLVVMIFIAAVVITIASPVARWMTNSRKLAGREIVVIGVILGLTLALNLLGPIGRDVYRTWDENNKADRICNTQGAVEAMRDSRWKDDYRKMWAWEDFCKAHLDDAAEKEIHENLKNRGYMDENGKLVF